MADYPEHQKLRDLNGANQRIGEFLEWLAGQDLCICGLHGEHYYPSGHSTESLIALFFEIDREKLEDEKRAMLAHIAKTHGERSQEQL